MSASVGTQAPALVRVLPRSCTRDCTRSPRGTRRSPAAWGPVRTRPARSSGWEPLNLRREGNAVTAALRKGEKPLLEKTAHASLNLRSFISKGNQRQTHRQHWIKVFQRKETACCKVKTAFTSLLKFTLHEMLNWKIIKGVSGIVKGKTKLFLKKNLKYNKRGMNDLEICVDRAWLPRGFMWGLVCK